MRLESSIRDNLQAKVREAWTYRDQDRGHAKELVESVRQTADGDALLETCANVVEAHIMMRGGLMVQALNLVLPALTWFEDENEQHWLARAFNVHNCVVGELGDFERCIAGLGRQLEISQRIGDAEMEVALILFSFLQVSEFAQFNVTLASRGLVVRVGSGIRPRARIRFDQLRRRHAGRDLSIHPITQPLPQH